MISLYLEKKLYNQTNKGKRENSQKLLRNFFFSLKNASGWIICLFFEQSADELL